LDVFGSGDYGVVVEDGVGYCGGDGTTGSVGLCVEEFEIVWEGEDGEEVGVGGYGCEKQGEEVVLCGWGV
jgi:hypothetical protein